VKFIGQHIVNLIARFRSSIYLEGVKTGTIASGGNLGLDSNNKIVKDSGVGVTDLHGAGVDGAANQLLTDDGDGTVTSESGLSFTSDTLSIGDDNANGVFIKRQDHGDGGGGHFNIAGANGTGANQNGGALKFYGGQGTGTGDGGDIEFWTAADGTAGSSLNGFGISPRLKVDADGDTTISGNLNIIGTIFSTGDATIFGNDIVFEGTSDDVHEATLSGGNPGSDITVTLPASTGTLALQNENTTGNAATATALETARAINGVDFDGTTPITVTAAGSTLSDTVPVSKGGTGVTTLTSNALLTGNGTSGIIAESNLTYDGTNLKITDSGLGAPDIIIESTSDHSSSGNLIFQKLRADDTPADGGSLGVISFNGEDTSNATQIYGQIVGVQEETGAGTEGGKIKLRVATHDGELQDGIVIEDGDAEDEIDVTIGQGTSSLTTIAGTLTMGSTAFVNNSGVVQVATQGTINHDSLANFEEEEHYRWDTDISATATINAANIPTLNQSTTGNAATATTLATTRALQVTLSETDSANFNGSAAVTDIGVTGTLAVGNGGTGATTFASNSLLTGNSTSAIQAEAELTYDSDTLLIGPDDLTASYIKKRSHSDGGGGSLQIWAAEGGGTNKSGGILAFYGGASTGTANGGNMRFYTCPSTADSDADVNPHVLRMSIEADGSVDFKNNVVSDFHRKLTPTSTSTSGDADGDVVYFGSGPSGGSTTAGYIYFYKSTGNWELADADSTTLGGNGFLGVSIGTDPSTDGMLVRGMVTHHVEIEGTEGKGAILYLSTTTGVATIAAPSSSGDIVRVIGYALDTDNDQMYFNPSMDWIEIA